MSCAYCSNPKPLNITPFIVYTYPQVSEYAASKRVVLKGDLPIGVDKRSVDTWMEPHLFRMDKSTGSPPDFFDPNGQNWGFPTYNWEAMGEEGYRW